MKTLTVSEMRTMDAGCDKTVKCPVCGYKHKASLIERLFKSNASVRMLLEARHMRGFSFNASRSVHK